MWTAQFIAALLAGSAAPSSVVKVVAVPVRVGVVDGECRYWNTDVGLKASQLEAHLAGMANKSLRVEMWLDGEPSEQCVVEAVSVAYRAGFRSIAMRPKTAKDTLGDPPR
jgi:polyribonucleotide nucleotidyltransferase